MDGCSEYLVCDVCGKSCKSKRSLAAHKRFHNPDYVRKIVHKDPGAVCDICGRRFNRMCGLARHMQFHDDDYAKAFSEGVGERSRILWKNNRDRMIEILNSPDVSRRKGNTLRSTYASGVYDSNARSAAMKAMYANPDNAERIAVMHEHIAESTRTPEERARRSERARHLAADEGFRRKVSRAVTNTWADESVANKRMSRRSSTPFSITSIESTRFGDILCDSNVERSALSEMCKDESIVSVERGWRIPYMKLGSIHSYYPDFVVTDSSDNTCVVEIKILKPTQ